MLRCSILAALVFVQATISTVAAIESGEYTISRQSLTKQDSLIYLAGTERTSVVSSYYRNIKEEPATWLVTTFYSGDKATYTFQWKATGRFMTFDKSAEDGVFIDTGITQHTFRLGLVDESKGRYRIVPPLKDGFSVTCGDSATLARWRPISDDNIDDKWDFSLVG